jgi:hypothetical protein
MQVLWKRKMQEFFRFGKREEKKRAWGELVVYGTIILKWMLKE